MAIVVNLGAHPEFNNIQTGEAFEWLRLKARHGKEKNIVYAQILFAEIVRLRELEDEISKT